MSDRFNTCDVVQDLLPLYHDGVLSDASRCLVAAHLEECPQCRQMLAALDESVAEERFHADSRTVLRRHRRLERRQALAIGLVIAGVLLLLMLVLGFGWQACAVAAAALLFLAALIVAPLVMKRNRQCAMAAAPRCAAQQNRRKEQRKCVNHQRRNGRTGFPTVA